MATWNLDCTSINWTATAEEVIAKVWSIRSDLERLARATEITDVTRQAA